MSSRKRDRALRNSLVLSSPVFFKIFSDKQTGSLALVFELMEMNLFEHIRDRKKPLPRQRVKEIMFSILKALYHLNKKGLFHRDVKPENILIDGSKIKLADFGSCKERFLPMPGTEYISTRWYRAPEALMTDGFYDEKIDSWSLGCIMFELITLCPLFPGQSELDQLKKISDVLGTPPGYLVEKFQNQATHMKLNFPSRQGSGLEALLPKENSKTLDLLGKLLEYDPMKRISVAEALRHSYFREMSGRESGMSKMPKMQDLK